MQELNKVEEAAARVGSAGCSSVRIKIKERVAASADLVGREVVEYEGRTIASRPQKWRVRHERRQVAAADRGHTTA